MLLFSIANSLDRIASGLEVLNEREENRGPI
jgi:hypothetical protein